MTKQKSKRRMDVFGGGVGHRKVKNERELNGILPDIKSSMVRPEEKKSPRNGIQSSNSEENDTENKAVRRS